jgi:hypothetical protein
VVALADSSMQVFSMAGRQLLPSIALTRPAAILRVMGTCVAVVAGSTLSLWDLQEQVWAVALTPLRLQSTPLNAVGY